MRRPFQCQNCEKSYNTKRELKNHEKRIHLGRFDFLCEVCSKSFVDQLSLKRHKANIHEPLKYNCHICQKSKFGQRSHLNEHLAQVHGCVKVSCEYCKKVLRDLKTKKQHILLMHQRENCSFQCDFCSKKFSNETLLKRHLVNVHQDKSESYRIECQFCSKTFFHELLAQDHEKKKHKREYYRNDRNENETISESVTLTNNSCTTATSNYTNAKELKQDSEDLIDNNVEQTLLAEIEDDPFTTFTCSNCSKIFFNQQELRRHVKKIHYGSDTRMKKFKCGVCPKYYSSRESLRRHVREYHENQTIEPLNQKFICPRCSKSYDHKESLRKHIRTKHEKIYGGQCYLCENKYFQDITRHHTKIHSAPTNEVLKTRTVCQQILAPNSGQSQCNKCGSHFKSMRALARHRHKVHSTNVKKMKPNPCSKCDKTFVSKNNLRIHCKTVHDLSRMFLCYQCGKSFTQLVTLQNHLLRVHSVSKSTYTI